MSETILNFGRNKGQDIADVYARDPQYCRWLNQQELIISTLPDVKAFLNSKFDGTDMSYVMTWGKYKRKSVLWIKQNDPGYITWLLSNDYVIANCPKLLAELKQSHY